MNYKRALGIGVAFYAVSFVVGLVITALSGYSPENPQIPATLWVAGIISSAVLAVFMTHWYFTKETPTAKKGIYLGLIFVALGFVFDMLFLIPVIVFSEYAGDFFSYYLEPFFWITVIVILGAVYLSAVALSKKQ